MKKVEAAESPAVLDEAAAPEESDYTLKIVGVYQDRASRDWALQICSRATQLAGVESVQTSWFKADFLSDPAVLLEAVRVALVADVIVVSVLAADELPLEVYVWIDAWLPRRLARVGALKALISFVEPLDAQSVRTFDYLQSVARKGQLDFIPQARQRAGASRNSTIKLIPERVSPAAQSPLEPERRRCDSYHHDGLNE